jgi:hypothetical protein
VTNLGPSNRNKIFARLYGGLSGSALAEFMAPIQLKPYELQYFYAPRLRHLAFERGRVSPLKKMTKCGQRPKTVAIAPKRDTVIIAELEFGKVAVQMLLAAMLVDALHPALKNRESDIGRAAA